MCFSKQHVSHMTLADVQQVSLSCATSLKTVLNQNRRLYEQHSSILLQAHVHTLAQMLSAQMSTTSRQTDLISSAFSQTVSDPVTETQINLLINVIYQLVTVIVIAITILTLFIILYHADSHKFMLRFLSNLIRIRLMSQRRLLCLLIRSSLFQILI